MFGGNTTPKDSANHVTETEAAPKWLPSVSILTDQLTPGICAQHAISNGIIKINDNE